MSSLYESEKGKRIYLYRNGDQTFFGKPLVVNKRQIRNVEVLLSVATSHLRMPEQVREIRTPTRGRFVVQRLEDLIEDQPYVAVGLGRFKKIEYTSLQDEHNRKLETLKKRREQVPQKTVQSVSTSNPILVPNVGATKDILIILVYANGDEFSACRKVVLRPRCLKNWSLILNEIDDTLKPAFGPVTRLFTLEGRAVLDQRDLTSGETYVAAGRCGTFKKVSYGNVKKFTVESHVKQQPYDSLFLTEHSATLHGESVTVGVSPREVTHSRQNNRDLKNNQRSRSQRLKYVDGAEVFPFRAKRHRRAKKKRRGSDVFRASKERVEVEGAEEVEEDEFDSYHPRNVSDILEEEEVGTNKESSSLSTGYIATPPSSKRPNNATGNIRRARQMDTVTPDKNKNDPRQISNNNQQQSHNHNYNNNNNNSNNNNKNNNNNNINSNNNNRRESGVGPSAQSPSEGLRAGSEGEGQINDDVRLKMIIRDDVSDVPDNQTSRKEEENKEEEEKRPGSFEMYSEERQKDEAARKIQKAFRNHRGEVRKEERIEEEKQEQEINQELEQDQDQDQDQYQEQERYQEYEQEEAEELKEEEQDYRDLDREGYEEEEEEEEEELLEDQEQERQKSATDEIYDDNLNQSYNESVNDRNDERSPHSEPVHSSPDKKRPNGQINKTQQQQRRIV